ncbi:hypothetical protein RCCWILLIS_26 [Rhodobacter phage RcCWillis]|nr:hypothetical protein RCCWILLIS_26 [Rhodobacter phage RcCWillis]
MGERMIRIKDVVAITSLCRSQIYQLVREGKFPQQHRISHKVSVWSESEVNRWVDEKLGLLV